MDDTKALESGPSSRQAISIKCQKSILLPLKHLLEELKVLQMEGGCRDEKAAYFKVLRMAEIIDIEIIRGF